ncbi:hypothetical protein FGO68_gene8371 [Halteria grandinella]|uniref:Uncharacterized protein n=1 Tax=Halteria grandinella TaxID=5974 RepID=A0A8J8SZG5_HALGN|nr:hypothetical protein FGO68_gene8371 [Halteria grandinella]
MDIISAHAALYGSRLIYFALWVFITDSVEKRTFYHLPEYLFVLIGGYFGWVIGKKLWIKNDIIGAQPQQDIENAIPNIAVAGVSVNLPSMRYDNLQETSASEASMEAIQQI